MNKDKLQWLIEKYTERDTQEAMIEAWEVLKDLKSLQEQEETTNNKNSRIEKAREKYHEWCDRTNIPELVIQKERKDYRDAILSNIPEQEETPKQDIKGDLQEQYDIWFMNWFEEWRYGKHLTKKTKPENELVYEQPLWDEYYD